MNHSVLPLLMCLFFLNISCTAQTYIGPSIGYDIATIEGEHVDYGHAMHSDQYSSFIYGVTAKHYLSGELAIASHWTYTQKEFEQDVIRICAVGLSDRPDYRRWYTMSLYRMEIVLQWEALDWFYLGAGPTMTYRSDVKLERYQFDAEQSIVTYSPARTEYGAQIHFGFNWKNIGLEFGYRHGLVRGNNKSAPGDRFEPLGSFSLSANYLFDISSL